MKAKIIWQQDMSFDSQLDGFNFAIDADVKVGGKNKGPSPKGLTLISLAGCTGMDIISILKKMKVEPDGFEIETDAELAAEHPKKIEKILIKYILKGKDIPEGKVIKAVSLSEEKYCGVLATLKPVVAITHEIIINDRKIG